MEWKRKQNRITLNNYIGFQIYFVTICTRDKRIVFNDSEIVNENIKLLTQFCDKYYFDVIVYCYMPDHVHLLVVSQQENANLVVFIKEYKQMSGYRYKQRVGSSLWQKSYYDHILRKEEISEKVVQYILENPVRRGLVDDFTKYPYSGSLKFGNDIFNILS